MDTRPRRALKRRGFTLAEILISCLLVAMGVTVWGCTFMPATVSMNKSRHLDEATAACYGELEAWRGRGYSNIPSGTGTVTLSTGQLIRPLPSELPSPTAQLAVRRVQLNGSPPSFSYQQVSADTGRLQLEMTMSWIGVGADRGSVTVTTVVVQ